MKHCGLHRELSAFIYPDWLSARERYKYDLRKLIEGVEAGRLPPPADEPIRVSAAAVRPPAQPTAPPPELDVTPESADEH